jgi:hypothetical protein
MGPAGQKHLAVVAPEVLCDEIDPVVLNLDIRHLWQRQDFLGVIWMSRRRRFARKTGLFDRK